jgi:hypothetical protein
MRTSLQCSKGRADSRDEVIVSKVRDIGFLPAGLLMTPPGPPLSWALRNISCCRCGISISARKQCRLGSTPPLHVNDSS